jgi:hypothetical protein
LSSIILLVLVADRRGEVVDVEAGVVKIISTVSTSCAFVFLVGRGELKHLSFGLQFVAATIFWTDSSFVVGCNAI